MNKSAIKTFAINARRKLIDDVTFQAGLLGITEKEIASPLKQSTADLQFFDIGTKKYAQVAGARIRQRNALVAAIREKAKEVDHGKAFRLVMEEVAYTWFNRLIAIRFMEVNDYLPDHVRVLSSENPNKLEPDIVTRPFDTDLSFAPQERDMVLTMKDENKLDELFRMLFIKRCDALRPMLPGLFEHTTEYAELLLSISFMDTDGVVYHLTHDIAESDFNVAQEGQVEIIGWLYQYYNTEPKSEAFAKGTVTKDEIPAVTQLFTPDWIVRYMVENSLGRLWMERNAGTARDEYDEYPGDANEYLSHKWKYYIFRAEQPPEVEEQLRKLWKDRAEMTPEDIRFIDPCMGSGHILVYAFDVFMQIYLFQGYTPRDAARSILQNNLFGADIDKRAYQLAYFAVMMKARQYNRRILTEGISPNLVAVQSPGKISSGALKRLGDLEPLGKRLLNTFAEAEEFGSILNVEFTGRELNALDAKLDELSEKALFANLLDAAEMNECVFALEPMLKQAQILGQKYHVTVTNPPYMAPTAKQKPFVEKNYPASKADLFAVFIEKCGQMLVPNGYQAMITMHSWMFLSSYEKLRLKLQQSTIVNMAHLGARAFEEIGGEVVQTTAFVLGRKHIADYKGVYCRLIESTTQQGKEDMFLAGKNRYSTDQSNFSKIPGSPVAYWVSESFTSLFDEKTIRDIAFAGIGMRTGDNDRFLRFWHEIERSKMYCSCANAEEALRVHAKWIPYNKGGEFRRWYGNNEYVVNWEDDGKEIKDNTRKVYPQLGDNLGWKISNEQYYFHEGITWTVVSTKKTSFRRYYQGAIISNSGQSVISDNTKLLDYLTGLLNTNIVADILAIISPTIGFESGYINKIPVIYNKSKSAAIQKLVNHNINYSRDDWDSFETSWDFQRHPLVIPIPSGEKERTVVNSGGDTYVMCPVEYAYTKWMLACDARFNQLKANEEELNRIFIDIYGLQDELTPEVEDKDVTVRKADLKRDIKSLISYAVGCMFGRYSLEREGLVFAGENFEDVFKRNCLKDNDGSRLTFGGISIAINTECSYVKVGDDWVPTAFPPDADNCIPITDTPYFEDDIVSRFVAFVKVVYGEDTLEENLQFIADALGNKGDTSREVIRNYFLSDFFKDHEKIYQKRPIYWLFDSGKQNGFKALVYMHRWNADTIGNVRAEYLERMQKKLDSEQERMDAIIEGSSLARDITRAQKQKEKLRKQAKECADYAQKLSHLANYRLDIDLDDGVKVNYRKVQTGPNGKFFEILADSKDIMVKEKK